jgi:hypothetical protein
MGQRGAEKEIEIGRKGERRRKKEMWNSEISVWSEGGLHVGKK